MVKRVARGQRRHSPPPGYITSTEAVKKLGKMLYKHVDAGRVRKITPEGYTHGFYHAGDVEAVLATEQAFSPQYVPGTWKNHPSFTFERAVASDMPAIVEISSHIFDDHGPVTPAEIRLTWLRKNPETFFVLRNQEGVTVGYASLLPLKRATLERFIHDEIQTEDITPEDIETFEPGKPLHLYFMSMGIEPSYTREKHEYGAALVRGLFTFFLDLASRGIELETITARSHKPDGLRLLRKMGIPQLHSPVPGKNLFAVRVAESGFPLFERYSEILAEYRQSHQEAQETPVSPQPHTPHKPATLQKTPGPRQSHEASADLPADLVAFTPFYEQHGISETSARRHIGKEYEIVKGEWNIGGYLIKQALDQQGQHAFYEYWHTHQRFTPCPDCPHQPGTL